ncbi:MAG: hypothetical protein EOR36_30465 [Mesorhizobium sp.]|uniref:hypothetical protein n=1 Tax=unclassified Mesorhizobium TaxID=325217 RepID=UPI000F74DDDC|nr:MULTISPECIES: hypothetical protein [unclassified Mesorhizobium]AZN98075.1 hypothetical protein EJ066_12965 [Mesorhizobium sp. M9A.F.Ca.ET.002.03.1.2]AZO19503.1 hypothetical protein EJ070_01420 [Mesorhizobium sp. M1E.F.Ca.ET.045.02.1.1]RWJ43581.1 MAG: hypothetical protein EOR29_17150 [Mesorhizobium sp.]RWJ79354.1 MAG: hypothetical protein EOR36_30465 [Mesorhizobium sp.]TGQ36896.1 hypothetical protein EN859_021045 [Mesorhizobium sp. M00.F.Ca.ET.216.01.1.1]
MISALSKTALPPSSLQGRADTVDRRTRTRRDGSAQFFLQGDRAGLRDAYLIAPPDTISAAAKLGESTYVTPGNFALSVAGEWLRRGPLGDQVASLRRLYAPRLEAMASALDEFMAGHRYVRPEGGFFVGVTLARPIDAAELRKQASDVGSTSQMAMAFSPANHQRRSCACPFARWTRMAARKTTTSAPIKNGSRRNEWHSFGRNNACCPFACSAAWADVMIGLAESRTGRIRDSAPGRC